MTAAALIAQLGMMPHPEGGHFREVYRSSFTVTPHDDRGTRPALTTIYFLLQHGEHSALHRVRSDEVWHFYDGAPLELVWWEPDGDRTEGVHLGPVGSTPAAAPVAVVPAGGWQAARTTGDYTLVGCTVGPGFDYADFALMRDDPAVEAALRSRRPDWVRWL